jgi:hypothetical protein
VSARFATSRLLFAALSFALALAVPVALAAPAPSSKPNPNPTPKQIRTAVREAQHSKRLWATVNICDTHKHPDALGIRSQVPALGFPTTITITLGVEFFSQTAKRYEPDPNVKKVIRLRNQTDGIHQRGFIFRFAKHTGRLRGTATFTWTRAGKVLGTAMKLTTAGHHDADFADPDGFSAATCKIT